MVLGIGFHKAISDWLAAVLPASQKLSFKLKCILTCFFNEVYSLFDKSFKKSTAE